MTGKYLRVWARDTFEDFMEETGGNPRRIFKNFVSSLALGYYDNVGYALKAGVNVNLDGGICLRRACIRGDIKAVDILLSEGSDVHVYNDQPLRNAVYNNHYDIVVKLINAGANVNVLNGVVYRLATEAGNKKMMKYLEEVRNV